MKKKCLVCANPVLQRGTKRKYCSLGCFLKHRSEKAAIPFTCQQCRKKFTRTKTHISQVGGNIESVKYCSRACKQLAETKDTILLPCEVCGGEVIRKGSTPNRKYCSYTCMGIGKKTGTVRPCANCGCDVYITKDRSTRYNRFYCSNKCRLEHQFSANSTWLSFAGSTSEYKLLRDKVMKRANWLGWNQKVHKAAKNLCEICKEPSSQIHHKIPLHVIISRNNFDYDLIKKDKLLLDPKNGQALCALCHAQTHGLVPLSSNA